MSSDLIPKAKNNEKKIGAAGNGAGRWGGIREKRRGLR
jgi:hypothetical protein